jgi:IS30 family transposase
LVIAAVHRQAARTGPSTISREVERNGGRRRYQALRVDKRHGSRARRPKPARLATNTLLRVVATDKLARKSSPEKIAGWLTRTRA